MKPDLRVCADIRELSLRAGEAAVRTISEAARSRGRCSLVLAGGSTPRTLYGLLASRFEQEIPWSLVHVFWGDERYVPLADAKSNYRMAKETLLDHVPCPAANVHPMPTHFASPEAAARDYEATLRTFFAGERPCFDSFFSVSDQRDTPLLSFQGPQCWRKRRVGSVPCRLRPTFRHV